MEIDHHRHVEITGPLCLDQKILAPIPVAVAGRIHPDTETDGIQAELLHQFSTLAPLAVSIAEVLTVGFVLGRPSDIGTLPIMPCAGGQQQKGRNRKQSGKQVHLLHIGSIFHFTGFPVQRR